MSIHRPMLVTHEKKTLLPLLIIDKTGVLGKALAEKLQEQFLVVLVTPTVSESLAAKRNIIHIPYRKKIPLIPDNIYSHVFLFYNGEEELIDMLPSFMKKANESAGKLFFILSLFHSSQSLFKHFSHHAFHHMRVYVYGEIFDNELREENLLNYFIHQARTIGRIEIPNGGMGRIYPVHTDDVLTGLIATAFVHERTNRVLLAFPKHEISELSAARMLQKILPDLKVDFRSYKKRSPKYFIPEEGAYVFSNYDVEARLKDIDYTRTLPRSERIQLKKTMIRKRRGHWNPLLIFGILFLYFFVFPVLLTGIFAAAGVGALQLALKEAEGANLSKARQLVSVAHFSFSSANTLADSLVYLDSILGEPKKNVQAQLAVGKQVSEVAQDLLGAAETIKQITDGTNTQSKQDFLHALATTKNTLLTMQKLKAEKVLPSQIEAKMESFDELLQILENTGDAYPTLLGFNGKKTYLVLFQNNMELRPGGGFIGSYGLFSMENGKMSKLDIHDVYDADGKLTKHVEPPFALRRYLGAAHWYLRDSNFDPDFTRNAPVAAQFLDLETKTRVDGVIAVDIIFIQKLLKAFGPIQVSDYNETVTADNFYLLTQTHAEKDFFPGSTQKKDFLRALFNSMMQHHAEKKQISYPMLADIFIESIKGKHLMFASSDNGIQEAFTVNNLSGALWDGRSGGEEVVLDYLGVVDANIGTNKVNYYMKRSIEQRAALQENGELQATVSVTYENTSKKESPFGGDYKNFVRFLVPAKAVVTGVIIDNQPIQTTAAIRDPEDFTAPGFVPPKELEIELTEASGKRSVGFLHVVPMGSKKTVSITYRIPQALIAGKPAFIYKLRVFKQPGTFDDPFSLFFTYPQNYTYLPNKKNGGTDVGGKINFQTTLSEDKDIELEFTKK